MLVGDSAWLQSAFQTFKFPFLPSSLRPFPSSFLLSFCPACLFFLIHTNIFEFCCHYSKKANPSVLVYFWACFFVFHLSLRFILSSPISAFLLKPLSSAFGSQPSSISKAAPFKVAKGFLIIHLTEFLSSHPPRLLCSWWSTKTTEQRRTG